MSMEASVAPDNTVVEPIYMLGDSIELNTILKSSLPNMGRLEKKVAIVTGQLVDKHLRDRLR
jgi:hypothetical protein